jgi:outer membrane protein assembly factor BamB
MWIYDSDLYVKHVETADLNGDDIPDVIAGEYDMTYYGEPSKVIAIDGKTGDTIWTYQLDDGIRSMTIGDINNDNVADVIAGASYLSSPTPDGRIHAIDGTDGSQLWTYYIGATITDVQIGDFNGDDNMDVAVASFDDHVYAIDGETGIRLWKKLIGSMWVNAVATGDVNGDNIDDVAFAHEYMTNYDNFYGVLDGTDGSFIWADTVPYAVLSVVMVDIDADDDLEAIFGGVYYDDHGEIFVRNAASGELEWSYDIGYIHHVNGAILLHPYDIDDDTDLDLVVGRYIGSYTLYAFDGDAPTLMWESDPLGVYPKDIAFGDYTGDGNLNIAVAGGDRVVVLKANGGAHVWYYAVGGTMASVSTGDLDDDGIDDVAAGGGADNVGSNPPNPQKSVWALKTVQSPVLWEFDLGEYGNEVAIGDVNGDGCEDVAAVASLGDRLWVIDGATGAELWHWAGTDNLFAVTIGDFDGNGLGDVAVGGYDAVVTAFVGETGALMWDFTTPTDDIYRKCLKSADLNHDGNVDVIAGSEDNHVYAISGDDGGELWNYDCGADVNDLVLYEMTGDDTLDIVVAVGGGTSGEKVVVIDGKDGSEYRAYSCPESVEHVALVFDSSLWRADPVAGLAPWARQVIRFNADTQMEEWSHPMELASSTHGLSVGDVNGDGVDDIAAPGNSTSMSVHMLDGSSGSELWSFPTAGEVNCVLIFDIDLDGDLEVIAGSDDQNVYVLDGLTGDEEFSYSTADDVMHIMVGDLNCDGEPNIVAVTFGSDGVVYAFKSLVTEPQYLCGDADSSGDVDIDDVVFLITYIFASGPPPEPLAAGDADCSGFVDIDDVVYLINYIFASGPAPCDPDGNGVPDC